MGSATRATVAIFGTIAGLAGVEHGVGEILQGDVAPAAMVFPSWPDSAFFAIEAGEPAMSLIPNMLATGILAIVASLAFLAWAVALSRREHAGLVLIALAVVMLLVGAGFGPPLLGVFVGLAATQIHSPLIWWHTRIIPVRRGALARAWTWSLAAAIAAWLVVSPGVPLLSLLLGVRAVVETLLLLAIPAAFGLLLLTIVAALARDAEGSAPARLWGMV